jgi:hypothetical protein
MTNASIIAEMVNSGYSKGLFYKVSRTTPAFTVTGAGTINVNAGTIIECANSLFSYSIATAVTMPSLSAGTDYAIYQCSDLTIRADSSFTSPAGYTSSNSRQVGGFHYAPGGTATFAYLDTSGNPHIFTQAQFLALAVAIRDYVYALNMYANGYGTLPVANIAIA